MYTIYCLYIYTYIYSRYNIDNVYFSHKIHGAAMSENKQGHLGGAFPQATHENGVLDDRFFRGFGHVGEVP